MLSAMRRLRLLSVAALFVIAGSVPTSLIAVMHDGGDDLQHQPSLVQHDERAHRVAAPAGTAAEQHCPVCHWLQSLQTIVGGTAGVETVDAFQHLVLLRPSIHSRPVEHTLPARAPPAV
jgi:hypothetical protein